MAGMKYVVVAAVIAGMLSACGSPAPEVTPSATVRPSLSPSPTPSSTPTPTPTVEPTTLPGCEVLLSLAEAKALFSQSTEFFGEFPAPEFGGRFETPEIGAALAGSSQSRLCRWGIPNSDGAFALATAQLQPSDQAALIAALTTAGFSSTTVAATTTMEMEREGLVSAEAATYVFVDDVLVACDGTSLSLTGQVTTLALAAVQAENPSLGS